MASCVLKHHAPHQEAGDSNTGAHEYCESEGHFRLSGGDLPLAAVLSDRGPAGHATEVTSFTNGVYHHATHGISSFFGHIRAF